MMFKKITISHLTIATAGVMFAVTTMPALAQYRFRNPYAATPSHTPQRPADKNMASSTARATEQVARMVERANREIDQRVTRLTALSTRIQGVKKISDANKTELTATIQSTITNLTDLKTKIAADMDIETLRTDLQSIASAYRIYALIMPQIAILGAADRAIVISDAMTAVSQKLQTRIASVQTAGHDVAALQSLLSDMNTKIADAKVQVQNAQKEVAALVPDNGDQTKFQQNSQALKDAHAKIKAAMEDLRDARKNAEIIRKALMTFAVKPFSSGQPSPSATPTPSQS